MGRSLLTAILPLSALAAEPEVAPLGPAAGLESIEVPAGFVVELVAAEPLVRDPVAFDWDVSGRLWVVEMADYPMGAEEGQAPGGRVRVLQDRDRDGTMDKASLFAEGLNFPNGVLTWRDGAIVTAAPDVLFLRDTTGDGLADEQEVLLTGLTTGNQQLRANGLRWGLDNWVYVAAGGHHGKYGLGTRIKSTRAGTETLVGSRDFRFRPDTGEVEAASGPTQFGRNRDDWGDWFGTQNSRPLWHYVLPDHYLRRNPHFAPPDGRVLLPGEVNPRVHPVKTPQKRYHSFEHADRYTSACSGMIYRDRDLFADEDGHAFACEPFHSLVQHLRIQPAGVTFTGRQDGLGREADFFVSKDRWCRPVMARTGPDGALWIADMYRYMIEHPHWLPEAAREELLPHYRAGDDRGRIYRVRRSGADPVPVPRVAEGDPVALLASPNGWVRDKAQQLLLWRGGRGSLAALGSLSDSPDARGRLHGLCVLDGLGALTAGEVLRALADEHPGVRRNALRLAEGRLTPEIERVILAMTGDSDARVRLQVAFTLGEVSPSQASATALARLLAASSGDQFLVAAVLSSALPHIHGLVRALPQSASADLRGRLAEIALGAGDRDSLAHLLSSALDDRPSLIVLLDVMAGHGLAVPALGKVSLTAGFEERVQAARLVMEDPMAPRAERLAAAGLVVRVRSERAKAFSFLAGQLSPSVPSGDLSVVLGLLGRTADPAVPALLIEAWAGFLPETRVLVLDRLLSRGPWTVALLKALDDGVVRPSALDPARRTRLLRHPDPEIRKRATRILESAGPSPRSEVVTRYEPALKLAGSGRRGLAVFQKACSSCHKRGEHGGRDLGPDLVTVAAHPPAKILANILDPNRDIQPGYHAYHCELKSGEQLFGQVAGETASSITLRLADGSRRAILRGDLAVLRSADVSLMPEGLEAGLSLQDMADLIAFVSGAP